MLSKLSIGLDRTNTSVIGQWWWTVDRWLLAAVGLLMFLGAVLIMASSHAVAQRIGLHPFYFANRQLFFLVIGVGLLFLFSMLNQVQMRRVAVISFALSMILLMLLPLIGDETKGARRWIDVFGTSIQPSEIAKPFFTVVLAWVLSLMHTKQAFPGFKIATGVYLFTALFLVIQPDIGMTVVYTVVWGALMFLAGMPVLIASILAGMGILGMVAAYFIFPHVSQRINTFLDPTKGDNYQVNKSLQSFANGGLLGQGPGDGEIKASLPDSHTDFIFAVAGEELGVIACIGIISIFAFILLRGFRRAMQENDLFVVYAVAGLLIQFGFQALVNMGVAVNLLPNKGITLPFISYGGSSMISVSITMGMVLGLTRRRFGTLHR
jgi:cell division protein FtsW